jgi:hypothetical protein
LETLRASFSHVNKYRKRVLALQGLLCQCEIIKTEWPESRPINAGQRTTEIDLS